MSFDMASANADLMRSHLKNFARGDLEAWLMGFSADAVLHARQDEPDAGVFQGREAIARSVVYRDGRLVFAPWSQHFEVLSWEYDDRTFVEEGDWVIAEGRLRGRARASGVTVESRYSFANRIEDGLIVEAREYRTIEDAVAAVRELERGRRSGADDVTANRA